MSNRRWARGIMGDGAVILYGGQPAPVDDVIDRLNQADRRESFLRRIGLGEVMAVADEDPCLPMGDNRITAEAKAALEDLIKGIESWAADEDGVHPDCWDAYCKARDMIGKPIRPDHDRMTPSQVAQAILNRRSVDDEMS